MLIKGTNVIGLKVITIERGEEIDDVSDIIYDPKGNCVKALLVDKGGWFSDAKVIPIHQVKNIGKDAVIIESDLVIKKVSELPERIEAIAKENKYLTKSRIITEEGNDLGIVTDVYFDPHTGKVEELEVSQGGLATLASGKKRVKISDIVTVGVSAIIVKAATEEEFETQAQDLGVQGIVTKGKDIFEDFKNKVTQEATITRDDIKSRYDQITSKEGQSGIRDDLQTSQIHLNSFVEEANKKIEHFASKIIDEAGKTFSTAREKASDFQKDPDTQKTVKQVKDQAGQAQQVFYSQVTRLQQNRTQKRIEDAVGQYLTKNILLPDDTVLGKQGDMTTHSMVKRAQDSGVLDQILENTSQQPL